MTLTEVIRHLFTLDLESLIDFKRKLDVLLDFAQFANSVIPMLNKLLKRHINPVIFKYADVLCTVISSALALLKERSVCLLKTHVIELQVRNRVFLLPTCEEICEVLVDFHVRVTKPIYYFFIELETRSITLAIPRQPLGCTRLIFQTKPDCTIVNDVESYLNLLVNLNTLLKSADRDVLDKLAKPLTQILRIFT